MAVVQVSDLRPGDRLTDFFGWGCVPRAAILCVEDEGDGLFVRCARGRHYLDGQTGGDGELVGCERAP